MSDNNLKNTTMQGEEQIAPVQETQQQIVQQPVTQQTIAAPATYSGAANPTAAKGYHLPFDRAQLKSNAKFCLKRYYGLALLVTLIITIVGGTANSGVSPTINYNLSSNNMQALSDDLNEFTESLAPAGSSTSLENSIPSSSTVTIGATIAIVALLSAVVIFATLYSAFVSNIFTSGSARFYTSARESDANINSLFFSFKNRYLKNVGTMFVSQLIVFAFILIPIIIYAALIIAAIITKNPFIILLCFPAIIALMIPAYIKQYQLLLVPYIIAENPTLSCKRVLALSKQMTKGYKWDLFVLGLSFIGWALLGVLCCGIGGFFLIPYISATNAEAYTLLKTNAKLNGITDDNELPGYFVDFKAAA